MTMIQLYYLSHHYIGRLHLHFFLRRPPPPHSLLHCEVEGVVSSGRRGRRGRDDEWEGVMAVSLVGKVNCWGEKWSWRYWIQMYS